VTNKKILSIHLHEQKDLADAHRTVADYAIFRLDTAISDQQHGELDHHFVKKY
jgi:hypothetical protein